MIAFFANIFGYVLNFCHMLCGNFGVAILLFTIFTKIVLLPLIIKQQKAMKKMAKVQPKLQALQDKYKEDKDREIYANEVTKLQKEEGFNPLTGCILSLIQIPIILAMFYIVRQPLTYMVKMDYEKIETYQQELPKDEQGNMIATKGYEEIEIIKSNPDIGIDLSFLGINLGDVPAQNNKNYILLIIPALSVIVTAVSIYITTKMNNEMNKDNPQYAETQKSMSMMNYMLPIMSGYIAYRVPLGLGLYWLASNLLQTIQSAILRKYFKDPEDNNVVEGTVIKEENS